MKYLFSFIVLFVLISCENHKIEIVQDLNETYLNINSNIQESRLLEPDLSSVAEDLKLFIKENSYANNELFLNYNIYINNEGLIEKIKLMKDDKDILAKFLLDDLSNWKFEKGLGQPKSGARFNLWAKYSPKTDEVKIKLGSGSISFNNSIIPEEYLISAEKMPSVIGGISSILKRLKYPALAKKAGIQGKVLVKAYINAQGKVDQATILKGIGAGCDSAAIDVVMNTKFKPGINEGNPVKTSVIIPIQFKLN